MIDKMGQVTEYSFNRCLWLHKDLCNFSHEAIMPRSSGCKYQK